MDYEFFLFVYFLTLLSFANFRRGKCFIIRRICDKPGVSLLSFNKLGCFVSKQDHTDSPGCVTLTFKERANLAVDVDT